MNQRNWFINSFDAPRSVWRDAGPVLASSLSHNARHCVSPIIPIPIAWRKCDCPTKNQGRLPSFSWLTSAPIEIYFIHTSHLASAIWRKMCYLLTHSYRNRWSNDCSYSPGQVAKVMLLNLSRGKAGRLTLIFWPLFKLMYVIWLSKLT